MDLAGRRGPPTPASPRSFWLSAACRERKKRLRPPPLAATPEGLAHDACPALPSPPPGPSRERAGAALVRAGLSSGRVLRPQPLPQRPPLENTKLRPYRVTMSALAASMATLKGSFPSSSLACWFAPLFRNRHTCLLREPAQRSIPCRKEPPQEKPSEESGRTPEAGRPTRCAPKWWHGAAALGPGCLSGSRWPRSGGGTHK